MKTEIKLDIRAQPDDETCGPTCLHALYRFYGENVPLKRVIREISRADFGGTLMEILACHALKRGYEATIYTYHVQLFDPTWFAADGGLHDPGGARDLLAAQLKHKRHQPRMATATRANREFLALGGQLRMEDLTAELIARHLAAGTPMLAGLSSTFLYREPRLIPGGSVEDDIKGHPQGHFVMLVGYDSRTHEVTVADPLDENPPFHTNRYRLHVSRLINAVLLGILTHDANLLVIQPGPEMIADARRARKRRRGTPKKKRSAGKTTRPPTTARRVR